MALSWYWVCYCAGGVENWKNVLDSRDWLKLKELELGIFLGDVDDCKVNDCGAEFLGSRSWPHLQILQLCTPPFTQSTTISQQPVWQLS